ncbi:trypsin-like serine protease [Kushneria aurantia]|uniref:Trypsin-like serine protease n=1 Tax=Kushneria aurantia TaxID=504092 RepID=A0ABV6FZ07_9GAMM|nr:trypsin-like serine protease [Kushneria aurantia]
MPTIASDTGSNVSRPGDGYDGVGRVSTATAVGSGTLLAGGQAVLTAAHVVEGDGPIRVAFDSTAGRLWMSVESMRIHSGYNDGNFSHDLALLWLNEEAPLFIPRYELYRDNDELARIATIVGYGATGSGTSGYIRGEGDQRSLVHNRIDLFNSDLSLSKAPAGSQLLADFDDGSWRYDTIGRLGGVQNTGLGDAEGAIAPGDSGGPAFIDGLLAGVASYIATFTYAGERLDINNETDSSFGEVMGWQRVSHYQSWIDDTLAGFSGSSVDDEDGTAIDMIGSGGDDLLLADNGSGTMSGLGGNDRFYVGSGDLRIDGGAGTDVVRVDLPLAAVVVGEQNNGVIRLESAAFGSDRLVNVELLRFADQVVLTREPTHHASQQTLFDPAFYLAVNPDVARAGVDPLTHYQQWGAAEGRDPNALFDERFYRHENPDVDAAISRGELNSGWEHYSAWGWQESRLPSAWMDTEAYLQDYPDIAAAGVNPFEHYLRWGIDEGRTISAIDGELWG